MNLYFNLDTAVQATEGAIQGLNDVMMPCESEQVKIGTLVFDNSYFLSGMPFVILTKGFDIAASASLAKVERDSKGARFFTWGQVNFIDGGSM